MALVEIEKNDIVATKDGRTIRVLAVYKNGDVVSKVEGIDDNEGSPMRRPVFAADILRVVRKAPKAEDKQASAVEEKVAPVVAKPEDKDRIEERKTAKGGK